MKDQPNITLSKFLESLSATNHTKTQAKNAFDITATYL